MLTKLIQTYNDFKARQRVGIALAKGVASMQARRIDERLPATWEFSGFSQNGEDGVIDVLRRCIAMPNRRLLEIGAADGTENNSSWLLLTGGYEGVVVEGDVRQAGVARRTVLRYSIGSQSLPLFVTLSTTQRIMEALGVRDPDIFSLDIDGNDFHVAKALFALGLRPKVVVVEYNSAFGPTMSVTPPYRDDFVRTSAHPSGLYYGVSLAAWKAFFAANGYRFVTVESNGVNAFFVDPTALHPGALAHVEALPFAENRYQLRAHGCDHAGQYAQIAGCPLETV